MAAMNYTTAVPALRPLPQVQIGALAPAMQVQVQPAPAIQVGDPLNDDNLSDAIREWKFRSHLRKTANAAVTENDVAAAYLRTIHIAEMHVAARQPYVNAPPWAAALQQELQQLRQDLQTGEQRQINQRQQELQQLRQDLQGQLQQMEQRQINQRQQELQQLRQDLQGQLQQMQQAVQDIQDGIQEILNRLTRNEAMLRNLPAASFNASIMACGDHQHNFRRFYKVMQGLGNALPGVRNVNVHIPALAVGVIVPEEFFPENNFALQSWTLAQINHLSMILNDNFGIERGDNVRERRFKLQEFLKHGAVQ